MNDLSFEECDKIYDELATAYDLIRRVHGKKKFIDILQNKLFDIATDIQEVLDAISDHVENMENGSDTR